MSLHASRDGHNNNTIHICQSGSCRRQGSEAVLLEIEELVSAVDNKCKVEASGCLGMCKQNYFVSFVQFQYSHFKRINVLNSFRS